MNDELGNRMKEQYETRTRYLLPRRTYTILRLDGKAFHTYTKGLKRPFDSDLIKDMNSAIVAMLPQLQGVEFAYTQSDEISILLTDFAKETTSAWFDGNIQKICSVSASIITAEFNRFRARRWGANYRASSFLSENGMNDDADNYADVSPFKVAHFDCRVFTIPDRVEVMNYFRWRQQDCIRNSVSMVAQSLFSHSELNGKNQRDMHDMLHAKGVNWATDFTDGEKNGRVIVKETYDVEETKVYFTKNIAQGQEMTLPSTKTRWVANGAWVFSKDEGKLLNTIPKYE